ncbi:MAG: Flp pilus assembly complex ATPase component TadA, partial [Chloroflexi bacterium]|nr:Flp pilus assembly complex ATPase component TadA [Chloroflexota bacterium]
LNDVPKEIEKGVYASMVSRIKLLAELKLNIKSEPQDGRFSIAFEKKQVEVRVAVAPSEFGESVVMRLLDPDAINISLEELGLRPDDRCRRLLHSMGIGTNAPSVP